MLGALHACHLLAVGVGAVAPRDDALHLLLKEVTWQVLGALHACHLLAAGVGAAAPGAFQGAAGRKEALSLILLNSMSLAVACRRAHACRASCPTGLRMPCLQAGADCGVACTVQRLRCCPGDQRVGRLVFLIQGAGLLAQAVRAGAGADRAGRRVGCSTYYSFCGNAAATLGGGAEAAAGNSSAIGEGLRGAVCRKWLHPIGMREHPAFSSWVIYGAAAGYAPAHGRAGAGGQWWLWEGAGFMQCRLQVRMLPGCACRLYVSHSQLHSNVCKSGVSATVK